MIHNTILLILWFTINILHSNKYILFCLQFNNETKKKNFYIYLYSGFNFCLEIIWLFSAWWPISPDTMFQIANYQTSYWQWEWARTREKTNKKMNPITRHAWKWSDHARSEYLFENSKRIFFFGNFMNWIGIVHTWYWVK